MRTRSTVAAVSAIMVSALIGGVFGRSALATSDSVPDHYRTFTAALTAIQSQYAEPVESDRMVYGAINGMLQTLDPHSSFMDPRTYAQMRERQDGLIINISSINGRKGQMGQANYSAAKAGLLGFTKAVAQENASKGITCNVIAPGYINTEMVAAVPKDVLETKILPLIPVGRLGTAEEIARCVTFLAADDAGFITGACLDANGGQYMA